MRCNLHQTIRPFSSISTVLNLNSSACEKGMCWLHDSVRKSCSGNVQFYTHILFTASDTRYIHRHTDADNTQTSADENNSLESGRVYTTHHFNKTSYTTCTLCHNMTMLSVAASTETRRLCTTVSRFGCIHRQIRRNRDKQPILLAKQTNILRNSLPTSVENPRGRRKRGILQGIWHPNYLCGGYWHVYLP